MPEHRHRPAIRTVVAVTLAALVAPLFDPQPTAATEHVTAEFTASPTSGEPSTTASRTNIVRTPRAGGTAAYTVGFVSYAGGVVVSNAISGNDDVFAGFDWREAGIQTAAGALSGGMSTLVAGRGSQAIMNGIIGFDATLWTMNLHGRTNPWELLGGTALSAVSPLLPRGPTYLPQFARGLARDTLVNAAGNLMNRAIQRFLPNTRTSTRGK